LPTGTVNMETLTLFDIIVHSIHKIPLPPKFGTQTI
jgi:hypothetical protein